MDLCGLLPSLNLYNRRWPIRTASYPDPIAKFTFDEDAHPGQAVGSIISGGCILSGSMVRGSVLGRGVNAKGESVIEDSVVLDNCIVGRQCKVRRAILDENVTVRDGECIGHDPEHDRIRHHVTDTGIVIATKRSANGSRAVCCPARHAPHACQQLAMFSFPTYRMIADFPIHCSMIFLISSRTARLDWARSSPCSTDRRTAYGNAEYGRSWQAAVLPLPDFCRFYSARPFRCHGRWYDAQWSPRPPSGSWETSPEFLPAWFRPAPGLPLCGV